MLLIFLLILILTQASTSRVPGVVNAVTIPHSPCRFCLLLNTNCPRFNAAFFTVTLIPLPVTTASFARALNRVPIPAAAPCHPMEASSGGHDGAGRR